MRLLSSPARFLLVGKHASQRFRSASTRALPADLQSLPLRLAVIGSGPAGFYAASRILGMKGSENVRIDMFEELPVPFGLARFGVAPDHPEVKNCTHKFEETASDKRFRYFGNVQIGGPKEPETLTEAEAKRAFIAPADPDKSSSLTASIPVALLKPHYHSILLTYGASHDRMLGIPGEEDLSNVISARTFVHLYNGHPYAKTSPSIRSLDLSKVDHVTIVGQGNVALDCARVLLSPVDDLKATDMPEEALAELARSKVKRVDVVGRRGPLQFAGTTKELREMMNLANVGFNSEPECIRQAEELLSANPKVANARMKKRLLALMKEGAKNLKVAPEKEWSLQYFRSPVSLHPSPYAEDLSPQLRPVKSVDWEINELVQDAAKEPDAWAVRGTEQILTSQTDLLLKSVGYRSIPISGIPFNDRRGIVWNDNGRVTDQNGQLVEGYYTSGWLSRGPTGVIATTMMDAYTTAELIAQDFIHQKLAPAELDELDVQALIGHDKKAVTWHDWQKIDQAERKRGLQLGKEREKFTTVRQMLDAVA